MLQRDIVLEQENKLIEAIKSSNVVYLGKILHDDLVFIAPDGTTITKEMDLASHKAGEMIVEELTADYKEIKTYEDSAIVIVVYTTKGKMLGNSIEGKFKYIRMWKLIDDEIKIIGGSCIQL